MGTLDKLTFATTSKKTENTQANLILRRKMVAALDEQLEAAHAEIAGQPYTRNTERWIELEDGSRQRQSVQTVLRKVWYRNSAGQVLVELRFGNKPLQIHGKPSILAGDLANLPVVLQTVREAVIQGELDADLLAASETRKRSRKSKAGPVVGTIPAVAGGKLDLPGKSGEPFSLRYEATSNAQGL